MTRNDAVIVRLRSWFRALPTLIAALLLIPALAPRAGNAPFLVRDINTTPQPRYNSPFDMMTIGKTLYFFADDGAYGGVLWRTDGTTTGTLPLKDGLYSTPKFMVNVNDKLCFNTDNDVWISNGTPAGTIRIYKGSIDTQASPHYLTAMNGALYFIVTSANGVELWKSDGTPAGTKIFKIISRDIQDATHHAYDLAAVNKTLYFPARSASNGLELWKSDGTAGGTALVKDIDAGTSDSQPVCLVNVNGTLYFFANDGIHGRELWKSNGTAGGTVLVRDINPGKADSFFPGEDLAMILSFFSNNYMTKESYCRSIDSSLYFVSNDGSHGYELWISDGTTAGTKMVKDILRAPINASGINIYNFTPPMMELNHKLFFWASDRLGWEPWISDGTEAGTKMVKMVRPAGNDCQVWGTVVMNGQVYFNILSNILGFWKSDGTEAGTVMIKEFSSMVLDPTTSSRMSVLGNTLFFNGYKRLWKSDGTTSGTVEFQDVRPNNSSSMGGGFLAAGNRVYFGANDGKIGMEPWCSDGTSAGTRLLKDIYPGSWSTPQIPNESGPYPLASDNGICYFCATEPTHGRELWKTDLTSGGTVLLRDLNPGKDDSYIFQDWVKLNGLQYFCAYDVTHGNRLWRTNGTTAGTLIALDKIGDTKIEPSYLLGNGKALFFINHTQLWKTDGTVGGTIQLSRDNPNGPMTAYLPTRPASVNGTVFFRAWSLNEGQELWKTDGTLAGTMLVKDINPGPAGSLTEQFTALMPGGVKLFFFADDGKNGMSLWVSNGTAAGTLRLKALRAGVYLNDRINFSNPYNPSVFAGGNLYFSASDGVHGAELWKSDGTVAGTVQVRDIYPGAMGSEPGSLVNVNGTVYFTADDGIHGRELWVSDGTFAGTRMVSDIAPGAFSSNIEGLTLAGKYLYFNAINPFGGQGQEPWALQVLP